jgi:hypothetical protein
VTALMPNNLVNAILFFFDLKINLLAFSGKLVCVQRLFLRLIGWDDRAI